MKFNCKNYKINEIDFNFNNGEHLANLFSETAYCIAQILQKELGATQFRKFYDKVLELNRKARSLDENDYKTKINPFVKLLYSKVAYAKERKVAGDNFEKFMFNSLDKVDSKETLNNFTLFLEAIIGFMPKNKKRA
jgi:CRISPR-associated protein Csm2